VKLSVVHYPGCFSLESIESLKEGYERLVDRAMASVHYASREHCQRMIYKWPLFVESAPWSQLLCLKDIAKEWLESPQVRLLGSSLVVKAPHTSLAIPWHQDILVSPTEDPRQLTCWLALDPVHEASGALRYREENGVVTIIPAEAGDLIVHWRTSWHASQPNQTSLFRRACLLNFAHPEARPRQGSWALEQYPVLD
jgi:hypothetical protein